MEYGKNQDGIGKKELLAVSFGTSYRENMALTIEVVEEELARAFSDYDLRRAFTSPTILRVLKERDGLGSIAWRKRWNGPSRMAWKSW